MPFTRRIMPLYRSRFEPLRTRGHRHDREVEVAVARRRGVAVAFHQRLRRCRAVEEGIFGVERRGRRVAIDLDAVEIFLQPSERFGLLPAVIGVLAGKVFDSDEDWLKLRLFFTLVKLQKRTGAVAPAIAWDALPEPARATIPEGTFV